MIDHNKREIVCSRHGKRFVERPWPLPEADGTKRTRPSTTAWGYGLVCLDCVRADRDRMRKAIGRIA